MDDANREPGFWQGIQTVLCCSGCMAKRPGRQRKIPKINIRISTISTIRTQSPRVKYCASAHTSGSIPVVLTSADTLSFPILGTVTEDVSIDDNKIRRRSTFFSAKRPQQICAKTNIYQIELTAQRTDEMLLEVPSLSVSRKKFSDYWTSNRKQKANWDSFFESQSSMMLTQANMSSEGHHDETTDWGDSDTYSSFPEVPNIADASVNENTSYNTHSTVPDLLQRKGDVLLSYMTANGMRYAFVPPDIRLEKVSGWLNQGSAFSIPISEHVHPKLRRSVKKNPSEFLNRTLSDVFGNGLDPERNGVAFFIGPVDGRVSFKMSLCELDALKKATRDIHSEESPFSSMASLRVD